ncbi:MAG: NADPH-dependent oxidoreductase [Clostridiales Family XIII bacterium]|jgi:nitroreductase|nr:NADPH-dependent oxidoreductase [Clostridiales Family XIII bacterium]
MGFETQTIEHQLAHRSIREFTDEKIPQDMLEAFLDVANRTATSTGMQSFSIVRVTDPGIRKQVADVCRQEYVTRVAELFIFIVDVYRNARIAEERGCTAKSRGDMDRFFQGYADAMLAAQNLTNAVESAGLGAVYFGSILNDPAAIVRILKLPELTFPAVGVGFGYPNQDPMAKPRMPVAMKVFENEYKRFDAYLPQIADYDKVMQGYYDLRENGKRADSFSEQVVKRLENTIPARAELLRVARAQGFDLGLE